MIRPEYIVEELSRYMPDADCDMVWRAYAFASKCHKGQKRVSGEPYLSHPLEVANILTAMKLGHISITVGLLHDTLEDTETSPNEIKDLFGEEVSMLVDGLTKISKLKFSSQEELQAENVRKMILAMSKDIRVIMIKLADRIHNMRTLHYLDKAKQKSISQETLEIYAPIASRLGMGWIKTELEDASFKYLWPDEYSEIKQNVIRVEKQRNQYVNLIVKEVEEFLYNEELSVSVAGRPKHYFSIFEKMRRLKISFEEVFDLMGVRIITSTKQECYLILGLLHSLYKPIPGKLDDYIALPKANMYQSLHTAIVGPEGKAVEFQIRTQGMHMVSEEGIAAHWRYKEGSPLNQEHDDQITWIRHLLEWQKDVDNPREFLEYVKIDLFPNDVYVFTPKQEVKALPKDATPIDFAFSVHTELGQHCIGAKVNGKLASLKQKLKNGDIIEIMSNEQQKPNRDWLKVVKTSKAKSKINSYIRQEERKRALEIGREILEKEIRHLGIDPHKLMEENKVLPPAQAIGYMSVNSLYTALGLGKVKVSNFLTKLAPVETAKAAKSKQSFTDAIKRFITRTPKPTKPQGIRVKGIDDVLIRFAKCCNPVPGDNVLGFISRGRGLMVHSVDCPNAITIGLESERVVAVEWDTEKEKKNSYKVGIEVETQNKPGVLAKVTAVMADENSNITDVNLSVKDEQTGIVSITLEVANLAQLQEMMDAVMKVNGVKNVKRVKNKHSSRGFNKSMSEK